MFLLQHFDCHTDLLMIQILPGASEKKHVSSRILSLPEPHRSTVRMHS